MHNFLTLLSKYIIMRGILATVILFFCVLPVKSQTFDFLDLPVVNELWIEFKDTVGSNVNISSPGSGQTWNYGNVFTVHDTIQYLQQPLVTAPPFLSTQFPQASSVTSGVNAGDFIFYRADIAGMFIEGSYLNTGFDVFGNTYNLIKYSSDLLFLPTPFDTGYVVQNTASYNYIFPDSSMLPNAQVRITYNTFQDFEADAQGSLITPLGTYNSVIRIKEMMTKTTLIELDSFSTGNFTYLTDIPEPTVYSYKWIKNGPNCLVMTASLNSAQQVTEASYFTSSGLVSDQSALHSAAPISLYPNPVASGGQIFIKKPIEQACSILVSDLSGRVIYTSFINKGQSVTESINLNPGIYLCKIISENHSMHTVKLSVTD